MKSVFAKWRDLRVRVLSAVVLLAIAGVAVWMGQAVFALLIGAVCGAMFWELQTIHAPKQSAWPLPMAAGFAGVTVFAAVFNDQVVALASAVAILIILAGLAMRNAGFGKRTVFLYGGVLAFVGVFLQIVLRSTGFSYLLLMLGTVILTDIAGYFFGRWLGGPKFWPSISPKKTWAGIIGGWASVCVLGMVLVSLGLLRPMAVPILVVMSFASQMGDIVESAMKRRADVKDSSNLIPGHGGFLDRFDGVIGAAIVLAPVVAIAV